MSIIHQALKKLETGRSGPGAAGVALPRGHAKGKARGRRPSARVTVLFVLSILIGGASLLQSYGGLNLLRPKAPPVREKAAPPAAVSRPVAEAPEALAVKAAPSAQARPTEAAPAGPASHNERGLRLFHEKLYAEAAASFRSAVESAASDGARAVYLNNLALSEIEIGDAKAADGHLYEALKLRPGYPEALNNVGKLLYRKGQMKSAEQLFRKAVKADSGLAEAHLNLAVLLERRGRLKEAAAEYERYVTTAPAGTDPAKIREIRARVIHLNSRLLGGG